MAISSCNKLDFASEKVEALTVRRLNFQEVPRRRQLRKLSELKWDIWLSCFLDIPLGGGGVRHGRIHSPVLLLFVLFSFRCTRSFPGRSRVDGCLTSLPCWLFRPCFTLALQACSQQLAMGPTSSHLALLPCFFVWKNTHIHVEKGQRQPKFSLWPFSTDTLCVTLFTVLSINQNFGELCSWVRFCYCDTSQQAHPKVGPGYAGNFFFLLELVMLW